jgi:hypothetical protein
MLNFDPIKHEYFWDGRKIPNVTTIIENVYDQLRYANPEDIKRGQELGTAVHLACELYDSNNLRDLTTSDGTDYLIPYLENWKKFRKEYEPEFLETEKRVFSKIWMFAGTMDRLAIIKGRLTIVDIKSGCESDLVQLQTAGYQIGYEEETKKKVKDRMVVYLDEKNFYPKYLNDPSDKSAFLGALNTYNFKLNHNLNHTKKEY